jgi:hypothetical protein
VGSSGTPGARASPPRRRQTRGARGQAGLCTRHEDARRRDKGRRTTRKRPRPGDERPLHDEQPPSMPTASCLARDAITLGPAPGHLPLRVRGSTRSSRWPERTPGCTGACPRGP